MARTTEEAVRLVISTSLTPPQILQFITDVSLWVTEELGDSGMSDDRLEVVERYLTCAFIRMRDLGLKSVQFDAGVSEVYQADLYVTEYLTRAAGLDKTGKIRQHFLTPANTKVGAFRVGTGFADES